MLRVICKMGSLNFINVRFNPKGVQELYSLGLVCCAHTLNISLSIKLRHGGAKSLQELVVKVNIITLSVIARDHNHT